MSNKKQTAVEWLREQFHKVPYSQFGNLFEQAKKMEKEQIEKSFDDGQDIEYEYHINSVKRQFNDGKQYYKETYGE